PAPVAAFAAPAEASAPAPASGRVPVEAIAGVDDAAKATLNGAGITWLDEYLAAAGPAESRKALAAQTGIDGRQLLEWANRADLMRLDGVSAALADLLENAGVDTVRELAQRNAANLAQKLQEAAGGAAPSEETIAAWIAQAKTLAPAVTH
ncbi:MAG TPA: DUF4332 domain-containing protein, partial [Tepidiformaceae bacterium]|nr:DUF4332 domain-containing protein [Tepidiformaceae bacterium]